MMQLNQVRIGCSAWLAAIPRLLTPEIALHRVQSKAGRRKSEARKTDRIGSTILMPDLKSADDAVQPKYCYCQQVRARAAQPRDSICDSIRG